MKKEYGLLLFLLLLAGAAFWLKTENPATEGETAFPAQVPGAWAYPVRPGTEEWEELGSTQKRREACRVPPEVLEGMDTAALLETALDYPFCADMLAFDRVEDGYRHQRGHNGALAVLETREDRHEIVRARLEDMRAWLEESGAETPLQYECLGIFERCME